MTEEDEEFNRIEREAAMRRAVEQALDKKAENARELGLDYEPVPENFMDALKFDVAMRDAAQRTWVGLTDEEIDEGCKQSWVTEQAFQSAVWWAEAKLKEKNT
jgi:hypothetical protein